MLCIAIVIVGAVAIICGFICKGGNRRGGGGGERHIRPLGRLLLEILCYMPFGWGGGWGMYPPMYRPYGIGPFGYGMDPWNGVARRPHRRHGGGCCRVRRMRRNWFPLDNAEPDAAHHDGELQQQQNAPRNSALNAFGSVNKFVFGEPCPGPSNAAMWAAVGAVIRRWNCVVPPGVFRALGVKVR